MDILLGLFLILFGVTIAFLGIQVFFAILPLLGFVSGFYVGAAGVEAIFGDGFLSTVTGWVAGLVVGLLFALIAWAWWYVGVLMSVGASGALVASGLAAAIGIDSGFILFLFGVAGAVALVFVALAINLPIFILIVNTAIAGAAIAVSGVMLVFNQLETDDLAEGFAVAMADVSWWWVLAWSILAGVGIGRQLTLKDRVRLPADRWTQAGTATA